MLDVLTIPSNRPRRWLFLVLLVLIGSSLPAGSSWGQEVSPADRPNILVLFADDWRWDTLGYAGNRVVRTPNLDAMAARGVWFRNARVTTSICWVSRASLFLGQWMARHGLERGGDPIPPESWARGYPALLRASGYWTGHVGKWHNGPFPGEEFDFGTSYMGRHYMTLADGTEIHVTDRNERDTLRFLEDRPKDRPFCLTLAFFATHAEDPNPKQYLYQPESAPLYEGVTIPVPATATEAHFRALPPFLATEKNEGRIRWYWRFDTPERYQESMKAYYRMATEVDAAIGRIVSKLEEQGALDNTLIVFMGDNGYFHGEHGLADKWYPYEESLRVPLIVVDPRMPEARRGLVNDDFVLNVDIAPTVLKAAGVPIPDEMQGRDFAPLYLDADPQSWRSEFYYEHPTVSNRDRIPSSRAVVRKDEKYSYWPEWDFEELYDLEADPFEEHNLAGDPVEAGRLRELRSRLEELMRRAR
jgi:arylsulfatase A-like enzyme